MGLSLRLLLCSLQVASTKSFPDNAISKDVVRHWRLQLPIRSVPQRQQHHAVVYAVGITDF